MLDVDRLANRALAVIAAAAHQGTGDITAPARAWIHSWIMSRADRLLTEPDLGVAAGNLLAMASLAARLVARHARALGKPVTLDEGFMALVEATIHASASEPTRLC